MSRSFVSDVESWEVFVGQLSPEEFVQGYESPEAAVDDYLQPEKYPFEEKPDWLRDSLISYIKSHLQ